MRDEMPRQLDLRAQNLPIPVERLNWHALAAFLPALPAGPSGGEAAE
jgi:hypothetical protein